MKGPKNIMTLFVLDDNDRRELMNREGIRPEPNIEKDHGSKASGSADSVNGKSHSGDILPSPIPVSRLKVTLSPDHFVFDGSAKTPEVIVRSGTFTLNAGSDYNVIFADNINAGQVYAEIKGKGWRYTGSVRVPFVIEPKPLSETDVRLYETEYVFDLREHTPDVNVKDGNILLKKGTDYTVKYENNLEIGTGAAIVQGIGNYIGTVRRTFVISAPVNVGGPEHDDLGKVAKYPDGEGPFIPDKPTHPGKDDKRRKSRSIFAACLVTLFIAGIAGVIAFSVGRNVGDKAPVASDSSNKESLIRASEGNGSSADSDMSEAATQLSSDNKNGADSSHKESSHKAESSSEMTEAGSSVTETHEKERSVGEESSKIISSVPERSVYTASSEPPKASEPSVVTSKPVTVSEPSQGGAEQKPDDGVSQSGAEVVSAPPVKQIAALKVVREPLKKKYNIGEALDLTGMRIKVQYTDGSSETVFGRDCIAEGFDSSKAGTNTVKVYCGERFVSIELTVEDSSQSDKSITGQCGAALTYKFSNGLLTINGEGDMFDYEESSPFADDMTVQKLKVKSGVTSIGKAAFSHCGELESAELADSIEFIDGDAFSECTSLAEVKFPLSLKRIGYCAFSNCISLRTLTLPDGLTTIEDNAFNGCSSLETIVIPESVTNIDQTAFEYCDGLTIYCKAGSQAEEFASKNGIKHSAL